MKVAHHVVTATLGAALLLLPAAARAQANLGGSSGGTAVVAPMAPIGSSAGGGEILTLRILRWSAQSRLTLGIAERFGQVESSLPKWTPAAASGLDSAREAVRLAVPRGR
ncbi:MAG TPA: hypothetical protein VMH61_03540 [Candidatus Acidoferrales bacterium]|nr:hypothetical protein [Candidatus Acidoferrales bacterium]